jgi:hypothetical protein
MPFKSRAQLRKFFILNKQGKISDKILEEWLKTTPSVKRLPERVSRKKSKKFKK